MPTYKKISDDDFTITSFFVINKILIEHTDTSLEFLSHTII